jgi:hypothetical protein
MRHILLQDEQTELNLMRPVLCTSPFFSTEYFETNSLKISGFFCIIPALSSHSYQCNQTQQQVTARVADENLQGYYILIQ